MLTFISCAKTMTDRSRVNVPFTSEPYFAEEAKQNAIKMAQYSVDDLSKVLRINQKLSSVNRMRYNDFISDNGKKLPALLSYTGMVFKRIHPADFTPEDFSYAQKHLLISSFLYGLLRPLDLIRNYRMEGYVKLPELGGVTVFDYWKPLLTDLFISEIKRSGGVLVNLASGEMKDLFDWKRVCQEVRVITPEFYALKNGKLVVVTVYAKMCRGEMTRFIMKNRIESPDELKQFEWEGFAYDEEESDGDRLCFLLR